MGAWLAYALVSAVLLLLLAAGVGLVTGEAAPAAWAAAAIAWPVQLVAFGALVAGRKRGLDFMVSWAGGMLLRFAVVVGAALWVTRGTELDAPTALLSLVGFVFVLVLLEPVFLRMAE